MMYFEKPRNFQTYAMQVASPLIDITHSRKSKLYVHFEAVTALNHHKHETKQEGVLLLPTKTNKPFEEGLLTLLKQRLEQKLTLGAFALALVEVTFLVGVDDTVGCRL